MFQAPPPWPPVLSIRLRLRGVAPRPQDRPLMRPPQPPQLRVWRLYRMLSWFWAARTPLRFLFCSSCGRGRSPRIELSSSVSATVWLLISFLIAVVFWSRICSVHRFFFLPSLRFCISPHICKCTAATTPNRDSKDSRKASALSWKTDKAAAPSGAGGCPRVSYFSMLQYEWCTSKGIAPCLPLGRTHRVGQSRRVGKKKPSEGEKKTVYDCRAIVDAAGVHSTREESPPSQMSTGMQLRPSHHPRNRCHRYHRQHPSRRRPTRQRPHYAAAA